GFLSNPPAITAPPSTLASTFAPRPAQLLSRCFLSLDAAGQQPVFTPMHDALHDIAQDKMSRRNHNRLYATSVDNPYSSLLITLLQLFRFIRMTRAVSP